MDENGTIAGRAKKIELKNLNDIYYLSKNLVARNPSYDGFYAIACGRLYFFSNVTVKCAVFFNMLLNESRVRRKTGIVRKKIVATATCS